MAQLKKNVTEARSLQGLGIVLIILGPQMRQVTPLGNLVFIAGLGALLLSAFRVKWSCGECQAPSHDKSIERCFSCGAVFSEV